MEDYETIILIKQEVFVFHIPPRTTNRGYRAADWKLHSPDWTGRMRVVSKGQKCYIKLEDKTTGELFAKAPIEKYPGLALEAVTDSSRYFVLRIEDDNGRAAFIGLGFADRGDSFDLNVSLQEHFKWVEKTEEIAKGGSESAEGKSSLDLGFKEGQTITINIGKKSSKPRPKPSTGAFSGTPGLLPPPPGGVKLPAPSTTKTQTSKSVTIPKDDLLLEFDVLKLSSDENPAQTASGMGETFGNFTTASGETSASEKKPNNTESWIGF